MPNRLSLLTVAAMLQLTSDSALPASSLAASQRNAASQIDVKAIFRAVGVPECIQRCSTGLIDEVHKLLAMEHSMDNYGSLCSEYNQASQCVNANKCPHADIFQLVVSGVGSLCGKKRPFIEKNQACLRGSVDKNANDCDQACHFVQSLADFSQELATRRVGLLRILEELGPLCRTTHCFIPCFRDLMNARSPRSGSVLANAFLRPFYSLAKYIEHGGEFVQKFVRERVPKECLYLTTKPSLDAIRQPMPNELREDDLPTAREDAERILGLGMQ